MKVWDFAQISSATPKLIIAPKTETELINVLNQYPTAKVSIAGGKFSHGGHTMLDNAIYVDTKYLNRIQQCTTQYITVQAGAKWWQVQRYLDRYNLSIAEMQSYNDFSIGGSISVNCHGRGLKYGTIADTIVSMKILTETGIHIASPESNTDLFQATIGGYGSMGIILEATLKLEPNHPIEKYTFKTPTKDSHHVIDQIKDNPAIVFYNGQIYPTEEEYTYHICWYKTDKNPTIPDRFQSRATWYPISMLLEQLLRRTTTFKKLRANLEPNNKPVICWKNYEMSYTTNTLKPLIKFPSTTVLQEYFVLPQNLQNFLTTFFNQSRNYKINILNISLRYVKSQTNIILNYAPVPKIAIVLYINVWRWDINNLRNWTRALLDKTQAQYYLPYLPLATPQQFQTRYPNYTKLIEIIKKYNPTNRFSNQFILDFIIKF